MKRLLSIALALVMVLSAGFVSRTAWADGYNVYASQDEFQLKAGQPVQLFVACDQGDIGFKYSWSYSPMYGGERVDLADETGEYLNLDDPMPGIYTCEVTDPGNGGHIISFTVYVDNELSALVYSQQGYCYNSMEQLTLETGDSYRMEVEVSALDTSIIKYQWYTRDFFDQNADSVPIEGATEKYYNIESFDGDPLVYKCIVTDRYGEQRDATYLVIPDNKLVARPSTQDGSDPGDASGSAYRVRKGDNVTFSAIVSAEDTEGLTYRWFNDNEPDTVLSMGSSLTIEDYDGTRQYYTCVVRDKYGNAESVYFVLQFDTRFDAWVEDGTGSCIVDPLAELDLEIKAQSDGFLAFEWETYDPETGQRIKLDETGPVLHVGPVRKQLYYYGTAKDYESEDAYRNYPYSYLNSEGFDFNINIDNALRAIHKNETSRITVTPLDPADLEVVVTAKDMSGIRYQWYDADGNGNGQAKELEGETSAVLHIDAVTGAKRYYCYISDGYGSMQNLYFYVYISNSLRYKYVGESEKTVSSGSQAQFEVTGSCSVGEVHYQWYERPSSDIYDLSQMTIIDGAVSAKYTTPAVTSTKHYTCLITDDYGSSTMAYCTARLDTGLKAKAANSNILVLPGDPASFEVIAGVNPGFGSVHYKWLVNGSVIDGETEATYTYPQISGSLNLHCVVSDDYGNSKNVWFYAGIDSEMIAHAASLNSVYVDLGNTAVLEVESGISDRSQLAVEWYKGETKLSETGLSLTTDPVESRQTYRCSVTFKGYTAAVAFDVCVDSGFYPSGGSSSIALGKGDSTEFKVDAGYYTGNVTYAWYKDNSLIEGQTSSTLTTGPFNGINTSYSCIAADEYGNSYTFYYWVASAASFTAKGETSLTAARGSSVDLEVIPLDDPDVTYQWFIDGGEISGATGTRFTTPAIEDAAIYTCRAIKGSVGYRVVFSIAIENGFYARIKGSDTVKVAEGGSVTFEVEAGSNSSVKYYWYGTHIDSDAPDGPSVTLYDIYSRGTVYCEVSDDCGNYETLRFNVEVDDGFQLEQLSDINVPAGERAMITLEGGYPNGDLTYQVYEADDTGRPGRILPLYSKDGNVFTTLKLYRDVIVSVSARDKNGATRAETAFTIHVLPEGGLMKGDVNGDNEISADDLTLLSRFVAGIEPIPSDAVKAACDVTGEGEVTADDLTKLSRKVAGIIQTLD